MIWLWLYLGSVLPAMLITAYLMGRVEAGQETTILAAIIVGFIWPFAVPLFGLMELLERAYKLGEQKE